MFSQLRNLARLDTDDFRGGTSAFLKGIFDQVHHIPTESRLSLSGISGDSAGPPRDSS
jgi:hypothetical protein